MEKPEVLAKESKPEGLQQAFVEGWTDAANHRVFQPMLHSQLDKKESPQEILSVSYIMAGLVHLIRFSADQNPVLFTGNDAAIESKPADEDLMNAREILDFFTRGFNEDTLSFPNDDRQYGSESRRITEELVQKLDQVVPS